MPTRPAKAFAGKLERLHQGRSAKLRKVPDAEVYALYFGASWCGPCRAFGRAIKPVYESGEPARLRYEIIFVSKDPPPEDIAYISASAMPWPFVRGDGRFSGGSLAEVGGRVLPDLVVVDVSGRVLCRAVDIHGRSAGVRQTFERMRAARRAAK
jgi:nucleoredoxin